MTNQIMFCKYCGKPIKPGAIFCPKCGHSLVNENPKQSNGASSVNNAGSIMASDSPGEYQILSFSEKAKKAVSVAKDVGQRVAGKRKGKDNSLLGSIVLGIIVFIILLIIL